MNPVELSAWCEEMCGLAARFEAGFESRFGFPPDEHLIAGPTEPAVLDEARHRGLPAALLALYAACAEVSLPDADAGYFVVPLTRVLHGLDDGDPVRLGGRSSGRILTFGSDGGGTLFALELDDGSVLGVAAERCARPRVRRRRRAPGGRGRP